MQVDDHFLSHEHFQLIDCQTCGLRATYPRPSPNKLPHYYHSPHYLSHSNRQDSFSDRLYHIARAWGLRNKLGILRHHHAAGPVLDIGCGTGAFLAYLAKRGYSVAGVEPEPAARSLAQTSLPRSSIFSSLDQVPVEHRFGTVTLWHVLEHVENPLTTLQTIHSRTTDNAMLFVAVPDRDSWDANHYGPDWAAWDVPRHLHHFRRTDIEDLLQRSGFTLAHTKRMWMDAFYISMLSERYRGATTGVDLLKGIPWGAWSNAVSLFSSKPTSSTLHIARRNSTTA
jgi:2-polyprenyl-3-methyl-5-hydroxy-6-metoxy-1,4-benzoquinol methylase